MTKVLNILSLFIAFSIQVNAQISIDNDALLMDIKSQLPANWTMEVKDSSVYITYPHEIQGIYKTSFKDKEPTYNANAAPIPLSDTVKMKKVSFVLLSLWPVISEKEVKKIVKENNKLIAKIDALPQKLNIEKGPGKGGPTSMLRFKDEDEESLYYSEKRELEKLLKDEPSYYSNDFCIYMIQFPYLSNDIDWDNEIVVGDVNFLNDLLRDKIKRYDN